MINSLKVFGKFILETIQRGWNIQLWCCCWLLSQRSIFGICNYSYGQSCEIFIILFLFQPWTEQSIQVIFLLLMQLNKTSIYLILICSSKKEPSVKDMKKRYFNEHNWRILDWFSWFVLSSSIVNHLHNDDNDTQTLMNA